MRGRDIIRAGLWLVFIVSCLLGVLGLCMTVWSLWGLYQSWRIGSDLAAAFVFFVFFAPGVLLSLLLLLARVAWPLIKRGWPEVKEREKPALKVDDEETRARKERFKTKASLVAGPACLLVGVICWITAYSIEPEREFGLAVEQFLAVGSWGTFFLGLFLNGLGFMRSCITR